MMGRLNHDQKQFFYSFSLDDAVPDDQLAFLFTHARRCQILCPRFVRQLIYFTRHENVSRKRKAPSALGIDTPTIWVRS